MSEEKKIAVIGLGYVGLPLAVEFGKFFKTIGYDISLERIADLRNGNDKTKEVSRASIKEAVRLSFSGQLEDLSNCNVFIITVPTPIDESNKPDLNPLQKASQLVGKVLKKGDVVIYESTVYPGCTEEVCVPLLESSSGLKFNDDFYCGYSPERINPGDKINTITKIIKITSGSTAQTAAFVDDLYRSIISAGTYMAASIKVAEAAKVIENTQRDINIALMNELSLIFERLGIDTLEVLEAAGSKWNFLPFRPGLVGGHCIGVDPYYLTHKAQAVGYSPEVILAGRRLNDDMSRYAAKKIIQKLVQKKVELASCHIGILGVTFKENCPDIRNSKVFDLLNEFDAWEINYSLVDPWCDIAEVKKEYGYTVVELSELPIVDALVIAVGHNEFRQLSAEQLKLFCKSESPVLADLKSIYPRELLEQAMFDVFRL